MRDALPRPGSRRKPADFTRIAHRGASGECPENTLVAFRRAIDLGAAMVECDLQLTADGHVVVIHDETVERTTGGAGRVCDLSLKDIRALDAGSWRGARFAGERVPTLEETLDAVAPRAALNLELKGNGDDARLVLSTLAAVSRSGVLDRVLFSSFDMRLLERLRTASPHARIAVLWSGPPFAEAWRLARELGAIALHPRAAVAAPDLIAEARAKGLMTHVWTVSSVERVVELVRLGVDGVISDHPGRLLEARARLLGA